MIIAELDEHGLLVKRFDDGADLPTRKPFVGTIGKQGHHIEYVPSFVRCAVRSLHQSTQQVTSRGRSSPVCTIHIDLTTVLFPCRSTEISICQRIPYASFASATASPLRAASSKICRNHSESRRAMRSASRSTRALCRPRGCVGLRQ